MKLKDKIFQIITFSNSFNEATDKIFDCIREEYFIQILKERYIYIRNLEIKNSKKYMKELISLGNLLNFYGIEKDKI